MSYYSALILSDNPTSYWRLDDSSGTTAVDLKGANNGTYVGSPTLGAPGLISGDTDAAVSFTGVAGENLTLPGPALASLAGSIEFWFGSWTAGTALMRDNTGTGASWIVGFSNAGTFAARVGNASTVNTSLTTASLQGVGTRHHLVLTCSGSGGTGNVYLDSVNVSSFTAGTTAPVMPWNFAQNGNITSQPTTMIGDEIALYNYVLSPSQILAHYQAGINAFNATGAGSFVFTGAAAGLVTVPATGTGSFSFTGAATGTAFLPGTAAGSYVFTGAAVGTAFLPATGTGAYAFTGSATGLVTLPGTLRLPGLVNPSEKTGGTAPVMLAGMVSPAEQEGDA